MHNGGCGLCVLGVDAVSAISNLLDFIDERAIIRRGVLGFTLGMTFWVTQKAWVFAAQSTFDGIGTAAVIAAIMTPTAALQAFAFNSYSKARE